jgi:hypothetical protein
VDGGEYIVPLVYTVSLRGKLVTVPVPPEGDALPEGEPVLLVDELVHPAAASPSNAVTTAAALAARHRPLFLVVGLTGPTSSGYASAVQLGIPAR